MRRRYFLAGLMATAGASAPWAAGPTKVYRLALVITESNPAFRTRFLDRLQQLGYTEGKNLIIDRHIVAGRSSYAEIARDLVRTKPDAIAVGIDNQLISQVAKEAYPIPVVALIPSVAAGLVQNVASPEGNITGLTLDAGIEMQGKQLDILRQATPSIARVAYLSNRADLEGALGPRDAGCGQSVGYFDRRHPARTVGW
jgi:putative ABC transport system substrate-binding protein